ELLLYVGPGQLTGRVARTPAEFGGYEVAVNQPVIALIGGVNRDPDVFAEPETLDLGRRPNQHFAFGRGIHFCLGAPLARVEGQIALGTLVRRFPKLRLTGEPAWRDQIVLRGLEALPVAL